MATFVSLKKGIIIGFLLTSGNAITVRGQGKHLLTPLDCTDIRYLATDNLSRRSPEQESPDHTKLAYVVELQNVEANASESALYVAQIGGSAYTKKKSVLVNTRIAGIQWFPDSKHMAALVERHGKSILVQIDTSTADIKTIGDPGEDIGDYAMDRNADEFVVSANIKATHNPNSIADSAIERGYRVSESLNGYAGDRPRREVYIFHKTPGGFWQKSKRLDFLSPVSGIAFSSLEVGGGMGISLSPNGRYLLVDNIEPTTGIPDRWRVSPYVEFQVERSGFVVVRYLYDLSAMRISIALESPLVRQNAIWSPDSESFAMLAVPPVGSIWEKMDLEKGGANDHNTHLFTVNLKTGLISEVLQRAEEEPLLWTDEGSLLIRESNGVIRTLKQESGGQWVEKTSIRIPLADLSPYSALITDGTRFIGDYQNASTAPELFEYDSKTAHLRVVTKLNPQVNKLILPRIERIKWTTSTGYQADGVLLLPPDYDPSRKYPLVIENGSLLYSGEFVCDSGVSHVSSFARGMLADAGIIYLM